MAKSLSIAAFLTSKGSSGRPTKLGEQPKRPDGTVIWVRCTAPDQLDAVASLQRKLAAEGDPLFLVTTLPDVPRAQRHRAILEPAGRDAIRAFIAHWRPAMMIWVSGQLDIRLMSEARDARLRSILVDATSDGLDAVAGSWVPGALRSLLLQFDAILALDHLAVERLISAGAAAEAIIPTGPMEDCAPTLPYLEAERAAIAAAIGMRPVWLAAGADPQECAILCDAHRVASKRTHRLLMIAAPDNPDDAKQMRQQMLDQDLNVALRSEIDSPSDSTQVYLIDTDEELGLWYRLAPVTYLGGTLSGAPCRDPFEATSLGSAVIYGPQVAPYQKHANRLNAAGGSRLIRTPADLGEALESLLSAEVAASQTLIAWDTATHGANVTNRIATYIQLRLEELAH